MDTLWLLLTSLNEDFMFLFSRLSCVRVSVDKFHPHETHFIPLNYHYLFLHLYYATSAYLVSMKFS
jgi:hypothetical protein